MAERLAAHELQVISYKPVEWFHIPFKWSVKGTPSVSGTCLRVLLHKICDTNVKTKKLRKGHEAPRGNLCQYAICMYYIYEVVAYIQNTNLHCLQNYLQQTEICTLQGLTTVCFLHRRAVKTTVSFQLKFATLTVTSKHHNVQYD